MEQDIAHILNLSDKHETERLVHDLSIPAARSLLELIAKSPKEFEEKIIPILAGLDLKHFIALADNPVFKPFVSQEVLQHRLNQAISYLQISLNAMRHALDAIETKLTLAASEDALNVCVQELKQVSNELENIHTINPILELTWLSSREDLTDAMSMIKTDYLHLKSYTHRLQNSIDQLREKIFGPLDNASSLDALASLGIIYPEDYVQVLHHLGQDTDVNDSRLIIKLENALKGVQLLTVKDFKQHQLFTKEQLLAYLNKVR